MKTLIVVGNNPRRVAHLQRQLDVAKRDFMVVSLGTALAGSRFDRILVTEEVDRIAYKEDLEGENTRRWLRDIQCRLAPGGCMVSL